MHLCPIPRLGGELTTSLQIRPRVMFFYWLKVPLHSVLGRPHRPIRVDHTDFFQVAIKTHSFIPLSKDY
jgi:hypothetical protein